MKNKRLSSTMLLLSSLVVSACGSAPVNSKSSSVKESVISTTSEKTSSSTSSETNPEPWPGPGGQGDNPGGPGGQGGPGGGPGQPGGPGGPGDSSNDKDNGINFEEYGTLPVINVTTAVGADGQNLPIESLENYTDATIGITNCDDEYAKEGLTGGIRLRGNSTSTFIKKPYRIKFDSKQSMLGLNNNSKFKSWVLLAEYNDYSYVHNYFTYHLGAAMDGIGFSPDSRYVEVYINNLYKGIYLLTEQIQVNKGRVQVDTSGEADGTIEDTGYLLELETTESRRKEEGEENKAWFRVDSYARDNHAERSWSSDTAFYVVKSDARSDAQMAYIKDYMGQVYDSIYKAKTEEAVTLLVDIDSAVDMYILQLIANDYDNNYSSFYLYKDAGGKLKFGPPWDFDLAYGSWSGNSSAETTYMYHLLLDLGKQSWFKDKVTAKLGEYMAEDGLINTVLADAKAEIALHKNDFDNREYAKWRKSNYHVFGMQYNSQDAALDAFDDWLGKRLTWIGTQFK